MHNSCQFPREIIIVYQQNSPKCCVFVCFRGARSNRSNPTSICLDCFEVETLEKHPNCKTLSRLISPLSLPNMENIGRAQPALQCCTLQSLERDHIHLWSNIESKVQNELKTQGFLHILAQTCTILVNFPEKLSYFISKTQKTLCFCIFSRGPFK